MVDPPDKRGSPADGPGAARRAGGEGQGRRQPRGVLRERSQL